jgi:para-nitrobenzyl esterase
MQSETRRLLAILASVAVLSGAEGPIVASGPVRIDSGFISGTSGERWTDVRVFKGVPFAAPPLGALRWRPPQPVSRWGGVRAADRFAASCFQPPRTGFLATIATSQRLGPSSEDCLYLNVWTAAPSGRERRPVMVWFPGGGFTTGGGSALVFDGEAMARKGVVVVTTNYRLGVFGFFAHPQLDRESPTARSGNYGLMDQIAALEWVKRNIGSFGGDPNRVTIFGQSAGSVSVFYQMASPRTKGLFHRAIGESGGGTSGALFGVATKRDDALNAAVKLAQSVGAHSIDDLRAVPAAQLQQHWIGDCIRACGTGPIIDGSIVTDEVLRVFRAGGQHNVPLLVGSNAGEGGANTIPAADYLAQSRSRFEDLFEQYVNLYPAGTEEQAKASQLMYGPDSMAWRMWKWADLHATTSTSKTFLYIFSRGAPPGDPEAGQAHHGAEVPYVFHNLDLFHHQWADSDHELEKIISSYWVNFATSGDPNGAGLPQWPSYTGSGRDRAMILGDTVKVGPSRLDAQKVAFFDAYYARLLSR